MVIQVTQKGRIGTLNTQKGRIGSVGWVPSKRHIWGWGGLGSDQKGTFGAGGGLGLSSETDIRITEANRLASNEKNLRAMP